MGFRISGLGVEEEISHMKFCFAVSWPGQFFGLFWQNTQRVYTDQIDSCFVLPGEGGISEPFEIVV